MNLAWTERAFADQFGRYAHLQELARNNYLDSRFLTDPPLNIDGYYFSSTVSSGVFTLTARGSSEYSARKPYYINQNLVLCSDPACTQVSDDNIVWFSLTGVGFRVKDMARCGIPGKSPVTSSTGLSLPSTGRSAPGGA